MIHTFKRQKVKHFIKQATILFVLLILLFWIAAHIVMFWKPNLVVTPYGAFPAGYVFENFGDRVAPYEGFLEVTKASIPQGYLEKSHHYTKREYSLTLTKTAGGKIFSIDITESDHATFGEPKYAPIREFVYEGCPGRIYSYPEHLTNKLVISLYWLNAPKQRLAISVQQIPSEEWSPDDIIRFLHGMVVAKGIPALVHFG